jgi:glycosyltransferase involved in cell wall biosynthesis
MNERIPLISLVIPCFNEEQNIPALVDACKSLVRDGDVEVILVDNGSQDSTGKVLLSESYGASNIRVVTVPVNNGYGHGILKGLEVANGTFIGWSHADLQANPRDVLKIIPELQNVTQNDKVFIKGKRHGRPVSDTIFTMGMSFFETFLFRTSLRDINAQPTIFSRSLISLFENPPNDFSLDLFAYLIAKHNHYSVSRVPVLFSPRLHGKSSWNTSWSNKKKFIKRTFSFSLDLRRRMNANN